MEHCQCKSMGNPVGHPNDMPIEHFHGAPNEQPQCKSMESPCITHGHHSMDSPMAHPHPIP